MAGALSRAQYAICRFTQTIALFLRQVTLPRMLAERPEPSFLTNTATAGTCPMASTDHAVQIFTAPIVTFTRLAVHPAVSRRVASTLATFTLTPSRAWQSGTSLALSDALLR